MHLRLSVCRRASLLAAVVTIHLLERKKEQTMHVDYWYLELVASVLWLRVQTLELNVNLIARGKPAQEETRVYRKNMFFSRSRVEAKPKLPTFSNKMNRAQIKQAINKRTLSWSIYFYWLQDVIIIVAFAAVIQEGWQRKWHELGT